MTDTSDKAIEALAAAPWAYASADLSAILITLQAERKAMLETVDDIIRASNTLMLLLVGDLPLTKQALEAAVRRSLAARTAWDDLGITPNTEAKP